MEIRSVDYEFFYVCMIKNLITNTRNLGYLIWILSRSKVVHETLFLKLKK